MKVVEDRAATHPDKIVPGLGVLCKCRKTTVFFELIQNKIVRTRVRISWIDLSISLKRFRRKNYKKCVGDDLHNNLLQCRWNGWCFPYDCSYVLVHFPVGNVVTRDFARNDGGEE
ncbi:hypothetical protein OU798_24690 [Prolixibacteraceae bacterium Z1-6]|uniref:Uncharacterized protein n=1 Tax=Draconibacterium aestuarii TaxID=2998507 RepID=A0A9X3FC12_9BACT|nr:hypothetical protein [Prolixibacteraceae bacterium Z1-6]